MPRIAENITELVGRTPLVHLRKRSLQDRRLA